MPRGCSPARVRELAPHHQCCLALSFGQVFELIARKSYGRIAVGLRAEKRVMLLSPRTYRLKKIFVGELGQGSTPVTADCSCVRADVADQRGEVWFQVVTPAAMEFVEQIGRPV